MSKLFNEIETNNDISTILQLTKDASEQYICTTEILDIEKYYTLNGKVSYHENITDVIFNGSYEENIIYYVQRYNDRFFKVLDMYDCIDDKYQKYLSNKDIKYFSMSLKSYIDILPNNTQQAYELHQIHLLCKYVLDINILNAIIKKYDLDISEYITIFNMLIDNLKNNIHAPFLSIVSIHEFFNYIPLPYLLPIRDKLEEIYYSYMKSYSLKDYCEKCYFLDFNKYGKNLIERYISELATYSELMYYLENSYSTHYTFRREIIEKIKSFNPTLEDIKYICTNFKNFNYTDFDLTIWIN